MRNAKLKINYLVKKTSVKNGLWMYYLQIFNTIVPLLTLPYITRILGTAGYGEFSIAINIIGYLQVVVEYGFGMSATRKVALSSKSKDEINKIYSGVLLSRLLLLALCFLFLIGYLIAHIRSTEQYLSLAILFISLFGSSVQQNWLFQGMQEMKYISIVNIISRIISVILIFTTVKSQDDLLLYCFLYAVSTFLSGFLGLLFAKIKYKIHFVKTDFADVIAELKKGWHVFTTQLSSKVFGSIGITFLGMFSIDSTTVGIYSAIQKIPSIMVLAWVPISQIMYPISSKKMQSSFLDGKHFIYRLRRLFLPLFSLVAILIAVFSKRVVTIAFGTEYAEYYYWIIPLLLWLIVSINNNFWGIQILLGSGHDKEYSRCFQLGIVYTIIFNLSLIYFFGGLGASLAPLFSECILGFALRIEIRKIEIRSVQNGVEPSSTL
ncbi:MAG: flippase [Desulfitobacterium hafniense]|nr:flippase [Desulfitobacterium hafniense]